MKNTKPRTLLKLRRRPHSSALVKMSNCWRMFAFTGTDFSISQATREAVLGSDTLELTTAEFDLLWLLASHAGEILSRDDIMNALRGIGFDGLDRSIDARISRLRKKLGDNPDTPTRIKTVRGKGYLFSRSDWE